MSMLFYSWKIIFLVYIRIRVQLPVTGTFLGRYRLGLRCRRNNLSIYRNGDGGFDLTVRGQDDGVRIAAGNCFSVFDGQDIAFAVGLAECFDIKSDILSVSGFCLKDFERIGFFTGDGDRFFDIGSRSAHQSGIFGFHFGKVEHRAADGQRDPCVGRVIGEDIDILLQAPAAIAVGVDFNGDDSLAAGGDLPRVGGDRAPSAGFDLGYGKGAVTRILYRKVMGNLGTVDHRVEFIFQFGQHCTWRFGSHGGRLGLAG
jgi:hypothetical protein